MDSPFILIGFHWANTWFLCPGLFLPAQGFIMLASPSSSSPTSPAPAASSGTSPVLCWISLRGGPNRGPQTGRFQHRKILSLHTFWSPQVQNRGVHGGVPSEGCVGSIWSGLSFGAWEQSCSPCVSSHGFPSACVRVQTSPVILS